MNNLTLQGPSHDLGAWDGLSQSRKQRPQSGKRMCAVVCTIQREEVPPEDMEWWPVCNKSHQVHRFSKMGGGALARALPRLRGMVC